MSTTAVTTAFFRKYFDYWSWCLAGIGSRSANFHRDRGTFHSVQICGSLCNNVFVDINEVTQ